MTRDEFREAVFARDLYMCVVCQEPGVDAHHIMERRLFADGGYNLANGATLCAKHHLEAEQTILSCEDIRKYARIELKWLPPHLCDGGRYDKWGNPYLANGLRMRGELFYDESVQRVLAPVLNSFTEHVKYPRTFHLPWSPGAAKSDCILTEKQTRDAFAGKEVVVTAKMDGENTTLYDDYLHARSTDPGSSDPSRHFMKGFHAGMGWQIPQGWRVCGENLYAEHTISYRDLPHYFMMFSIWNERNEALSWDDTVQWAQLLELETVPVLWRGIYDQKVLESLYTPYLGSNELEGYVVRLAGSFPYARFRQSVAKYVKAGFEPKHRRAGVFFTNKLRDKR